MKEVNYLVDWFERYLKNRDIYFKKIKNITQKEDLLTVEEKERTVTYHIIPFAEDLSAITKDWEEGSHKGIVLYNTEANLKALLVAWSVLSKIKGLIIYFVNPFSKLDKKWVVYPHTHDKITEKSALKPGLKTLFDTVETTTKEEVEKIVNS